MSLLDKLDQDIKDSLRRGDNLRLDTLRSLKSALTYASIESNNDKASLTDSQAIDIFIKEAKKRQDSADVYRQGGASDRADKELAEKKIIDGYLPEAMNDQELSSLVDEVIDELDAKGAEAMGKVISTVQIQANGRADGARIAKAAKERLLSR